MKFSCHAGASAPVRARRARAALPLRALALRSHAVQNIFNYGIIICCLRRAAKLECAAAAVGRRRRRGRTRVRAREKERQGDYINLISPSLTMLADCARDATACVDIYVYKTRGPRVMVLHKLPRAPPPPRVFIKVTRR